MKPFNVRLRFHGDLNLFLGPKAGDAVIERWLAEKTSIKDVIESCGVPHPEVDLIFVDEHTVGFDHTLDSDKMIHIFPVGALGARVARTNGYKLLGLPDLLLMDI